MTSDGFFNGSMTLDELVKEAHNNAIYHGWWIYPRTALEMHALMHTEIAEATEAARIGNVDQQLEELADVIIRVADYCGYRKWDLSQATVRKMAYNRTRPFRHGNKLF